MLSENSSFKTVAKLLLMKTSSSTSNMKHYFCDFEGKSTFEFLFNIEFHPLVFFKNLFI